MGTDAYIKELITIVVPVYNSEKYIENFLKSVLDQIYTNYELILINDGSTDESILKAEKILNQSNINFKIINKENGGQSTARNVGINEAKGNYIVMPDSDDFLQPDYLEAMYDSIKLNNANVAICDLQYVNDEMIDKKNDKDFVEEYSKGKEYFKKFFMHDISIGPISIMFEKKLVDELNLRFDESSHYSEEFIFITQLLYSADVVTHVKKALYNYCLRPGSVSTGANLDVILNGYQEIIKASIKFNNDDIYCKMYNKYAHARWILATSRFTSKRLKYREYRILLNKLNAKEEMKKLFYLKDKKIVVAARVLSISKVLAFNLFKLI